MRRSHPLLPVLGALALMAAACGGADEGSVQAEPAPEITVIRGSSPAEEPSTDPAEEPSTAPPEAPPPDPPPSIEDWVDSLPLAAFGWDPPKTIPYGEDRTVHFRIDPSATAEAVAQAMQEAQTPGEEAPVRGGEMPLADEMCARLYRDGDLLSARPAECLSVSRRRPTEWTWTLQPEGWDPIQLELDVLVKPVGREPTAWKSFEDSVMVQVTLPQRARKLWDENWEWAWTFVVGPVGAWMFARRRKRRAPAGEQTPDGEQS